MKMNNNLKTQKFVAKSALLHKNLDYSQVNYINSTTKIKLRCTIHDFVFEQTPKSNLKGQNACPFCNGRINKTQFIEISNILFDNQYDYSLVKYINKKTNVLIRCKKHDFIFSKSPDLHLQGQGCPKCSSSYMDDTYFKEKSNEIHNDSFIYLTKYIKSNEKISIQCKKCNHIFNQTPNHHLQGHGCPKCAIKNTHKRLTKTNDDFLNDTKTAHKGIYSYPDKYIDAKTKINITCHIHGDFEQRASDHINSNHGCPLCAKEKKQSNAEKEINEFINSFNIKTIISDRKILDGKELDIYIPTHNLAIEFNGLYWHNEINKPNKKYHLNKTIKCKDEGIELIHIFEDEWIERKEVVKSIIKNRLKLSRNKIYARKTEIKEIDTKIAKDFMNNNHIQGYTNSSVKIGLYYENRLVSAMLFTKKVVGGRISFDGYELSRFVNLKDTNVVGAASKLLKYFEKVYNPIEIRSYVDRRWFDGKMYETLGFEQTHINNISYWYVIGNQRKHKSLFKKSSIRKQGFSTEGKTEHEVMLERKIYRIYDCGTISYSKKY